jgi:long-chain fatty acid transport protein
VATVVLAAVAAPSTARAGGFYLLDRGTRPMGRGGAWVAGADDPGALWYNPAGLGLSGEQLLIDATMTFLSVDYTRIDGAGNLMPTVHGSGAPVPIPTIAGTFDFGLRDFTFGVALMAPNAALMQYPEELVVDGMPYPAPQRYSLLSMEGSVIATVALGAAWTPLRDPAGNSQLSIGLALHTVVGAFAARVAMSACEAAICTFPEDPDYDAVAQMTLAPIVTATVIAGVTWTPGPVRLGFSLGTPFALSGGASIQVRPPAAAAFEGAVVRSRAGDCGGIADEEVVNDPDHRCRDTGADINLNFPVTVRLGVELLAVENLRLEAAVVWETWSLQNDVSVRPRDVWIVDALGFLDYEVGPLSIPRNMSDTVSVRLGGEYTIDGMVQLRLGGYYENGAFSDQYLSPLTIDSDKVVVAAGASVRVHEGLWLDVMGGYAHLFARQVRDSRVPQSNPIRPALPDLDPDRQPGDPVYIGNGDYSFVTPFFGIGVRWQADWIAPGTAPAEPEPDPEILEIAPEPAPETETAPLDPSRPWYQQGAGASAPATGGAAPAADPATDPPSEEVAPDEDATAAPDDDDDRSRRSRGRRGRRGRRSRGR